MIACRQCRHFFITWEKTAPYGCHALGFKSRVIPIRAVQQATPGMNCQFFEAKATVDK
ncbi:MAG: uracil-DNA glycosylase [Pseudomonadota bacterium]